MFLIKFIKRLILSTLLAPIIWVAYVFFKKILIRGKSKSKDICASFLENNNIKEVVKDREYKSQVMLRYIESVSWSVCSGLDNNELLSDAERDYCADIAMYFRTVHLSTSNTREKTKLMRVLSSDLRKMRDLLPQGSDEHRKLESALKGDLDSMMYIFERLVRKVPASQ